MTLLDAVKSFGPKITENYRETRFCDFAPPDETVGVIDVSASGNGSGSFYSHLGAGRLRL